MLGVWSSACCGCAGRCRSDGPCRTLRASLSGTFLQRNDAVNQCLVFVSAAVAALESGVCTWSSSCVSLLIHLTQAVAVGCSGVSLFVHLTQAVALQVELVGRSGV